MKLSAEGAREAHDMYLMLHERLAESLRTEANKLRCKAGRADGKRKRADEEAAAAVEAEATNAEELARCLSFENMFSEKW